MQDFRVSILGGVIVLASSTFLEKVLSHAVFDMDTNDAYLL